MEIPAPNVFSGGQGQAKPEAALGDICRLLNIITLIITCFQIRAEIEA